MLGGRVYPAGTLSVSVGGACARIDRGARPGDNAAAGEALFQAADAALYRAKNGGRDRAWVSDQEE